MFEVFCNTKIFNWRHCSTARIMFSPPILIVVYDMEKSVV